MNEGTNIGLLTLFYQVKTYKQTSIIIILLSP